MRLEWQKKVVVSYYYKLFFSRQLKKKLWSKRNQWYISMGKQHMTQKIPAFVFIRSYFQVLIQVFFTEILSSDKWWSWTFQTTVLSEIVRLQNVTWGQKIAYDKNRIKR